MDPTNLIFHFISKFYNIDRDCITANGEELKEIELSLVQNIWKYKF